VRNPCPEHGWFKGLVSSDAQWHVESAHFKKPATVPLAFSTEVKDGCPRDRGLCPEHKQHTCLTLTEVSTCRAAECHR
jgi:uncharacterized radical SAM superfamily Fe-S cluster-containing enzyme